MLIFIRRGSAVLLLCILILSLAFIAIVAGAQKTQTKQICLLLDAGHGAPDGGCVAADGTQEAVLNLQMCKQLQKTLAARGFAVKLTRTDENGLYGDTQGISKQKKADMRRRRELRDTAGADLFVSLHMNSFSQEKYHGAQVIYDTTNAQAQQAALCIQNAIRTKADNENKRVPMAAPSTLYLLRTPRVPSVIVECGFLSNTEECAKLKTQEYQVLLADAIADGIETYFEKMRAGQSVEGETSKLER